MIGSITLTAHTTNGVSDSIQLSGGTTLHASIEFTPNDTVSPDLSHVILSDGLGIQEDATVYFERTCTPDNPFYVRWVNSLGGFEYYMFGQNKVYSDESAGFVDFAPVQSEGVESNRSREIIGISEAKRTVTVGAEQLEKDMFIMLSNMQYSPRIDTYNVALKKWEGVTFDDTTRTKWDTANSLGTIEYVFRLNTPNLQF